MAFAMGPLIETPYPGAAGPLPDWDTYVFRNGHIPVPELPCRAAWRKARAKRKTLPIEPFTPTSLHLPGIGRRLQFTGFWHEPTRLARWARASLIAQDSGKLRLGLRTCGGVHLWLNGSHVVGFEPYTRNEISETVATVAIPAGRSELVLLMEDMAERDTEFLAELTHMDGPEFDMEPSPDLSMGLANDLAALAASLRPARHIFEPNDTLRLTSDHAPSRPMPITARVIPSDHLTHHPPIARFDAQIGAGQTDAMLGPAIKVPDGYHPLALTIGTAPLSVDRRIAITRMAERVPDWPDDLAGRKRLALTHAADHGEPRAGRLLAHLALGRPWGKTCDAILDDTLTIVGRRKDCADFVLVPLLWILFRHREDMPDRDWTRACEVVRDFRYWVDEVGNDTMWFWSENHVLCFHVSQLLAGLLLPDAIFPASDRIGREQADLAEIRLNRWFDAVEAHGLAEWNSAAYYPIDFIGLFALYTLDDGPLSARAKVLLDTIFRMLALHTIGGISAGSMGRAYDKELKAGPLPELAPFVAAAFGEGWLTRGVAAMPMFALSDYSPDLELRSLIDPPQGAAVEAQYSQGDGRAGQLHLYKTSAIQLSVGSGGTPGVPGHQQHVIDVQAAANPFARVWINHPGEDDPFGLSRPSHWAGNGILPKIGAFGPDALLLYRLGAGAERAFTHAYAPRAAFDEVVDGPDWCVMRSGRGAVILKATGTLQVMTHGAGAGCEIRLSGETGGWSVSVVELDDPSDIALLTRRAKAMALKFDGEGRLIMIEPGRLELRLDWNAGLTRGENAVPPIPQTVVPQIRKLSL